MRTLQIGMTAAQTRRGGVDRYYFSLLEALPLIGVRARGLVAGDASVAQSSIRIESFARDDVSLLRRLRGIRRIARRAMRDTDVLVSHFAPYALPMLDYMGWRPLVVHFHGPWKLESRLEGAGLLAVMAKGMLERFVYSCASRFVVLSRAFGEILVREYRVPPERVRVVPGGVEISRFRAICSRDVARRRLGWPADRPIVATVRRLVHAKGLENLVESVTRLRRDVPDVMVFIVGTGPLAADLQRLIDERNLGNHVRLAGHVADDELPSVYRAADLFVVPTIALEGFGLVVLEALASGTPALVTPVGGLPEVVSDLAPSLVLAGTSSGHIADGLSAALRGALPLPSEQECSQYADGFDWSVIAGRVAGVYREVA